MITRLAEVDGSLYLTKYCLDSDPGGGGGGDLLIVVDLQNEREFTYNVNLEAKMKPEKLVL